jgi:hypothetical protein
LRDKLSAAERKLHEMEEEAKSASYRSEDLILGLEKVGTEYMQ